MLKWQDLLRICWYVNSFFLSLRQGVERRGQRWSAHVPRVLHGLPPDRRAQERLPAPGKPPPEPAAGVRPAGRGHPRDPGGERNITRKVIVFKAPLLSLKVFSLCLKPLIVFEDAELRSSQRVGRVSSSSGREKKRSPFCGLQGALVY